MQPKMQGCMQVAHIARSLSCRPRNVGNLGEEESRNTRSDEKLRLRKALLQPLLARLLAAGHRSSSWAKACCSHASSYPEWRWPNRCARHGSHGGLEYRCSTHSHSRLGESRSWDNRSLAEYQVGSGGRSFQMGYHCQNRRSKYRCHFRNPR